VGLFDERTGGLVTYWKSVSAITALVGSADDARIHPHMSAQGAAAPRITYERAATRSATHLRGHSGFRVSVVHVRCYGSTLATADALAEAVKVNTQNQRGTWSGTTINHVFCSDGFDDEAFQRKPASDEKDFVVRLVLRIGHSEAGGT